MVVTERDIKKEYNLARVLLHQLKELHRGEEEAAIIDQETIDIVVESETLYVETAQACVLRIATAEALIDAIKGIQRYHLLRRQRLEEHVEAIRVALAETMLALGKPTMELPSGTASAKLSKPKLVIDSEAAIADRFKVLELKSQMVVDKGSLEAALIAYQKKEVETPDELTPEDVITGARWVAEPKFSIKVRKT